MTTSAPAKILTHNLDGGETINGVHNGSGLRPIAALLNVLDTEGADLIGLQQVTDIILPTLQRELEARGYHVSPLTHVIYPQTAGTSPVTGSLIASRQEMTHFAEDRLHYRRGGRYFTLSHAMTSIGPTANPIPVRFANTHLHPWSEEQAPGAPLARRRQCQMIAATLAPFVDAAIPTVLVGDLNETPTRPGVSLLYDGGDFVECDEPKRSTRDNRSKIDYVFVSKAHLSGFATPVPLDSLTSSHHLLRTTATILRAPA